MPFRPTPIDGYPTPTSETQLETESIISELFKDEPPALDRNAHVNYLGRCLLQGLPSKYQVQEASKAWIMFWILQSFSLLGVGLDPASKQRAINTIMRFQYPDGGFGGGPNQFPHLLATYAAVSALAIVGRPGPDGGWDQIDREKMYAWFMSLKQPDGSFIVSKDSEVDIRGVYCLLVTATLLDLLTPELIAGLPEFIASCQTYEGGFSCASQPFFDTPNEGDPSVLLEWPRPALGEAHGGYSYCAVAAWALLRPFLKPDGPKIDLRMLMRWLANMQGTEVELGGFRGRTNKLVDGCYSWWVGAEFGVVEWLLGETLDKDDVRNEPSEESKQEAEEWHDVEDGLFNKQALQQYVLMAAQASTGGLRDKPGKGADAYHTLYNLAGLSSAQHHFAQSTNLLQSLLEQWNAGAGIPAGDNVKLGDSPRDHDMRKTMWAEMSSWLEDEHQPESRFVGGKANRLNAIHPILTLTMTHSRGMLNHFYGQSGIVYV
ncbi:terpenoid cyclases/Protein prenyltransferase [Auricularia subglabra TFB-10046 SS5]|nr:terpenoid cyclases/Protein prenyltransferase [Auricularia subglabra TFB-10046 SS5]